jgi:hypothetical protein
VFFELIQHLVFTKIALNEMDVMNRLHFEKIESDHHAGIANPPGSDLGPATRRCAKVDDDLARLEQLVLVVDLQQFEGGA